MWSLPCEEFDISVDDKDIEERAYINEQEERNVWMVERKLKEIIRNFLTPRG